MQETTEMTIDLRELFFILLRGAKWIILAAVLGTFIAFAITWWKIPPKYTSSISLYVHNTAESTQVTGALNFADLTASQQLVNTYIVILQNDEVLEQVSDRLMEEYTQESLGAILPLSTQSDGSKILMPGTLRGVITMSAVNETEVLRIEAETKNPELSAAICTIMAEVAPETLQRVVKAGSVEVIGRAKPAILPSSPNLIVNMVIGFIVGGVLSVIAILLVNMMDNTVTNEEDLKKHFTIPVLGEIPDFDIESKRKDKKYYY